MLCACWLVLTRREALGHLAEELGEWVAKPSRDEVSDVMFSIGRLVGAMRGVHYVSMPGDKLHWKKITRRMQEYGCIRSKRNVCR